jgi:hypothetical protein
MSGSILFSFLSEFCHCSAKGFTIANRPIRMFPCYLNVNINAQTVFADVNCFLITNTPLPLKGVFRVDTFDFQTTARHFRAHWLRRAASARHPLPEPTITARAKASNVKHNLRATLSNYHKIFKCLSPSTTSFRLRSAGSM